MGKGGNQNPQMEEKQTAQWTKEKGQKDNDLKKTLHLNLKIE
jgi:hypothetical protein